ISATKVFIIILFIIALLFVISINLGALHSDDHTFQKPAWLNSIGATLANPQPLNVADLHPGAANCLQQRKLIVQAGGSCTFTIQKSTFAVRVARIRLAQGASAQVSLSQEDTLTVQKTFPGDAATQNDLKVYPGKAHRPLVIQCTNAGGLAACVLELQ